MLKIAIIAGEPSGDMLAAGLVRELKANSSMPISFMGIGGECMAREGFISLFAMHHLSVMGVFEVFRHLPKILKIRAKILHEIIKFKPDVFIGVDLPDFNFSVEKKLKRHGIKTVHYISPTIWAWKYERIFKIKKTTDLMLCIFPMEQPLYRAENIPAQFVGHSLADQIEFDINTAAYKRELGLTGEVFSVLVGSRAAEVKRLAPIFIETCSLIAQEVPHATFIFPLVNQRTYDAFTKIISATSVGFPYKILLNQTSIAIKASDLVIAKSGTVTLEVALCKKPLIISYKIAKLTEWIIKRKIKIKYVGQPNILLNELVVPECLQEDANPQTLSHTFLNLYHDKVQQKVMIDKFYLLHSMLRQDASKKAATAILSLLTKSSLRM